MKKAEETFVREVKRLRDSLLAGEKNTNPVGPYCPCRRSLHGSLGDGGGPPDLPPHTSAVLELRSSDLPNFSTQEQRVALQFGDWLTYPVLVYISMCNLSVRQAFGTFVECRGRVAQAHGCHGDG